MTVKGVAHALVRTLPLYQLISRAEARILQQRFQLAFPPRIAPVKSLRAYSAGGR